MDDETMIPPPNYTQIPNMVLDLMPDMSDSELRVVLAIARQTFGWHKKRDKISLSQLIRLTGMSRQGVINGLDAGIKRKLIERRPDPDDRRGGIWYRLLVNDVDQSTPLTSLPTNQSTPLTGSSQRSRPDLVNGVDTQKKGKEKKETREGAQAPTPAPAPAAASLNGKKPTTDPNQTHPASLVYLEVTGYRPERASAARIAQCIPREPQALEVWRTVVETWITSGSRRGNVDGMIDRYNARGITNAAQKQHDRGQRDQRRAQPSADRAPVRAFDLEHDI